MAHPFAAPTVRLRWSRSVRIVEAHRQPLELFEAVADPDDLDVVLATKRLTAPDDAALSDLAPRLAELPVAHRAGGMGSSDAMTPFLYYPIDGARFSDGTFGAYYAARDRNTAIAETVYHRERFLAARRAPSMSIEMQVLHAAIDVPVRDLRGQMAAHPELYAADPADYAAPQAFARAVRAESARGIVYDSLRQRGGQCVALFRARDVAPVVRAERLRYLWSGTVRRIVRTEQVQVLDVP